jgi:hypothetical protein
MRDPIEEWRGVLRKGRRVILCRLGCGAILEPLDYFECRNIVDDWLTMPIVPAYRRCGGPKRVALRVMDEHDDGDLIKAAAQEFIDRLGRDAVDELNALAEIATGIDDEETAETWREIARAAKALIN